MEELRKIAEAHYQASSDNVKKLAHDFFSTMDKDGDGKIDLWEFLSFMEDEGCAQMKSRNFFEKLDRDQNGTLDFFEFMALYYIVKSGRPFCDHCQDFIPGTYFTCVGCLEGPVGGTFHACLDCYLNRGSHHTHDGVPRFLDNYSLLEAKIRSGMNQSISTEERSRPSTPMVPSPAMVPIPNTASTTVNNNWGHNTYIYTPPAPPRYYGAISPQQQKRKIALAALDAAIKIGVISASVSSCSIV